MKINKKAKQKIIYLVFARGVFYMNILQILFFNKFSF